MSFFKGRELYSVDSKGRVNIPAKMRKNIAPEANDTFVITRGPDDDPCIYAYPLDEWKQFEERLKQLNQFNEQERFFLRTLLYWSDEVTLDKQFRISLPKSLLDFSRIEKNAMILGSMDHIEIWDPEIFENYLGKKQESYASIAESVMGLRRI
jgi:MraZ protein